MPIIRGAHDFDESFTRIPNRWLRDERLSLKAIGLLAQLHSHAVGWRLSIQTLAQANDCGIDLIRGAISELEKAGYLRREQSRGANSQFAESVWTTIDPSLGFPSTAKPSTENPLHKKNNLKKTKEKKDIPNSFERFDEFWQNYPRKVGKNSALKAYTTARSRFAGTIQEFEAIVTTGALALSQDPNLPPSQYVPYPTTWLNREGWNDEPYPERQRSPEEIAAQAKALRDKQREQSLAETQKLLAEAESVKPQPIPLCQHGEKIVSCRTCLRSQAKKDKDG
jgi:hypothetical protein